MAGGYFLDQNVWMMGVVRYATTFLQYHKEAKFVPQSFRPKLTLEHGVMLLPVAWKGFPYGKKITIVLVDHGSGTMTNGLRR